MIDWIKRHRALSIAAVLAAATVALLLVAVSFRKPEVKLNAQEQIGVKWIKPAGAEAAYAGSEACKTCHAKEFEQYHASPHSHTLKRIVNGDKRPEFALKQTVTDDRKNITYTLLEGGGKNQLVASTATGNQLAAARWAFGSGEQAFTYLAQNGPKFLQMRISYYPPVNEWNFTPGSGPGSFHIALGDPYNSMEAAACFGCHTTVLTGTRQSLDLDHSIQNVGCESCHGPSKAHAESALQAGGPTIKPPLNGGQKSLEMCGTCHRFTGAASDDDSDNSPQLARFPGKALPKSRCFRDSQGQLNCVTCHNPHQSTHDQTIASFESKCLSCHTAPHGAPCARGETADCIRCHMPQEQIAARLSLKFHNHYIRRNPLNLD
jgi:hypothetical protein